MENELETTEVENKYQPDYVGTMPEMFGLAAKTTALTLVTAGIYRFWAKTRIRRYVWSSIKIDGDGAEYTGTGLEKLLGFLVAIVILAIYLGVLQVLLSFAGLSLLGAFMDEAQTEAEILAQLGVTYITFLALLPLIFFAQYRSRRYMLSRTRWRGLRLGVSPGAGGYVWRGVLFYFLAILTLGLLTPLATFKLEKYMADRTWYGDGQFEQRGRWTALYGPMKHIFIGIGFLILAGVSGVLEIIGLAIICGIVGYIWIIIGGVYFQVHSFRYLTANKVLDGEVQFEALPRTGFVIKTYLLGSMLVGTIFSMALSPAIVFMAMLFMEDFSGVRAVFGGFIVLVTYIVALVIGNAASMTFIHQPILSHFVTTSTILNVDHLETIRQRADDSIPDADGFADALDIGGGF